VVWDRGIFRMYASNTLLKRSSGEKNGIVYHWTKKQRISFKAGRNCNHAAEQDVLVNYGTGCRT